MAFLMVLIAWAGLFGVPILVAAALIERAERQARQEPPGYVDTSRGLRKP